VSVVRVESSNVPLCCRRGKRLTAWSASETLLISPVVRVERMGTEERNAAYTSRFRIVVPTTTCRKVMRSITHASTGLVAVTVAARGAS
jgi:hypothetical protein